jgi:hypothetical protein
LSGNPATKNKYTVAKQKTTKAKVFLPHQT